MPPQERYINTPMETNLHKRLLYRLRNFDGKKVRDVVGHFQLELLGIVRIIDLVEAKIAVFVVVHPYQRLVEKRRQQDAHGTTVHGNEDVPLMRSGKDRVDHRNLTFPHIQRAFATFGCKLNITGFPGIDQPAVIVIVARIGFAAFTVSPRYFVQPGVAFMRYAEPDEPADGLMCSL